MDGEREGGYLSVRKSIYPEPDGYLKMRVRDIIAGAIVLSCFALAVLLGQIWPKIVRKISRLSLMTAADCAAPENNGFPPPSPIREHEK
jgi:hypothetical protein